MMSEGSWLFFQYMYDFLEAVITSQTSKEEAYRKLEEMAKNQTETLSKLTKQVLAYRALGPLRGQIYPFTSILISQFEIIQYNEHWYFV